MRAGGAGHPRVLHADRAYGDARSPQGKEIARDFDGRDYVLEPAHHRRLRARQGVEGRPARQPRLPPDGAELQPDGGDRRRRSRSPRSRSSSSVGDARSRHVHTPGIFVQRIFKGASYEKRIERRTVQRRRALSGHRPASRSSRARRAGAARRHLRQPRHRHADARRQLHPGGRRGRAPERERPARHRPVPVAGEESTPT